MSYPMHEGEGKFGEGANTLGSVDTGLWRRESRRTDAQLPRYVNMLIKLFQVLYYVFLVVPSLNNMLEVKSSQKLMVHISPCGTHVKWL